MSDSNRTTDEGHLTAEANYSTKVWPQKIPPLDAIVKKTGEKYARSNEVTGQIGEILEAGPRSLEDRIEAAPEYLRQLAPEVIVFFIRLTNQSKYQSLHAAFKNDLCERIAKRAMFHAKTKAIPVLVLTSLSVRQVEYIKLNEKDQEDFCHDAVQSICAAILDRAKCEQADFAEVNFITYLKRRLEDLNKNGEFQAALRLRATANLIPADTTDNENDRADYPQVKAQGPSPEEQAAQKELLSILKQTITRLIEARELTGDEVAAFLLHECDEQSYSQIAAVFGCTYAQARYKVDKTRQLLAPLRKAQE